MDSFTEKKWFVYLGDHHEGPFSLEEIQRKMDQNVVSKENYVWADGMKDWRPMTDMPEFGPLLLPKPPTLISAEEVGISQPLVLEPIQEIAPTLGESPMPSLSDFISDNSPASNVLNTQVVSEPLPSQEAELKETRPMTVSSSEEKTGDLDISELQKVKALGAEAENAPARVEVKRQASEAASAPLVAKRKKGHVSGKAVALIVLLTVAVGGRYYFDQGYFDGFLKNPSIQENIKSLSKKSHPYVLNLLDKYPALGQWLSPLPSIENVGLDEYEALKAAALQPPEKGGPRVAIALSKANPLNPSFYVASNLPDGTRFQIDVIGVSDTLLNHLAFKTQVDVVLTERFGVSKPVQFTDGKPMPKGEYLVYLSPVSNQLAAVQTLLSLAQTVTHRPTNEIPKDAKVLAYKTYFLGGNRDAVYTNRLKEYHDKLRLRASEEIKEVSQFLSTLESQYFSTNTKFSALRKGKITSKQKQAWSTFHGDWIKLQEQLDLTFRKWTPESIHNDYFYDNLYLLTQQLASAVEKVHGLHHALMNGIGDPKTLEIQIGEAVSSTQITISLLKTKIEQAMALPLSPNGMPQREGI